MKQEINLDVIVDQKELKALAYDQLQILEQSQHNLKAINSRLEFLQSQQITDESQ